jgi:hypothetical protein
MTGLRFLPEREPFTLRKDRTCNQCGELFPRGTKAGTFLSHVKFCGKDPDYYKGWTRQTRLAVDRPIPDQYIIDTFCTESCYTAQHKRCKCRCNGVFHGMGGVGINGGDHVDPEITASLARKYRVAFRINVCDCGFNSLKDLPLRYYPHSAGWNVQGLGSVWLYVQCPQCHYQWALWKLGVDRNFTP